MKYHKALLYIEKYQDHLLSLIRKTEGRSRSWVIRTALDKYFAKHLSKDLHLELQKIKEDLQKED